MCYIVIFPLNLPRQTFKLQAKPPAHHKKISFLEHELFFFFLNGHFGLAEKRPREPLDQNTVKTVGSKMPNVFTHLPKGLLGSKTIIQSSGMSVLKILYWTLNIETPGFGSTSLNKGIRNQIRDPVPI
jgi:hypothetical protein